MIKKRGQQTPPTCVYVRRNKVRSGQCGLYLLTYYSLIVENYTGNFIDKSLVDKQHVDTKMSPF